MTVRFKDDKHAAGTLLEAEALLHSCGQPSEYDDVSAGFHIPAIIMAELCSLLLSYAEKYEGYEGHQTSTLDLYIEAGSTPSTEFGLH